MEGVVPIGLPVAYDFSKKRIQSTVHTLARGITCRVVRTGTELVYLQQPANFIHNLTINFAASV